MDKTIKTLIVFLVGIAPFAWGCTLLLLGRTETVLFIGALLFTVGISILIVSGLQMLKLAGKPKP
jgi:hypothetical protein